jgi:CelD/BcsL family acetyltransferase involved in cellulose biosynthesis
VFEVAVENRFDFLSPEYAALFEASAATPFQHPVWLSALYARLLALNNASPLIVVVRKASDKSLAMVLPLVKRRYGILKVVEFADLRVTDYVAAVTDRRSFLSILSQGTVRRQLLRMLEPYDVLRIGKLGDTSLPMNRLFGIPERRPMGSNAYAVPLEGTFEVWRNRYLNRSYAKELGKKGRQLARRGHVEFAQVTDPAGIRQAFDALKVFRRDRFDAELLQTPAYFDFYLSVAERTDFARTYCMTLDGKPIAAALGIAHNGAFLVILGGFTQTDLKNQSVGSLMFEQIARDCIAHGDTLLDFTIGDEPYKMTFGATPSPMWQMSRAGSLLGFAAAAAIDKMPAAKALARSLFHHRGGRPTDGPSGGTPAAPADPLESEAPAPKPALP